MQNTDVRYAHIHAGTSFTDANGVSHTGKGRLLATVATQEMPDGTLAVGVARCREGDLPTRFTGRQIAAARLNRLLRVDSGEDRRPSQCETLAKEKADLLAFRIGREDFVSKVIRGGLLRRLSMAKDHDTLQTTQREFRAIIR